MSIKYPLQYALGQPNVQSFPKVQYAKIKEIIDAVNASTSAIDALGTEVVTDLVTTNEVDTDQVVIAKVGVTQGTSITTAVTANQAAGVITTVALTTAGGSTSGPFTVNNSFVVPTSIILLTAEYASGKTGNPIVMTEGTPGTGTFKIKVGNGAPAATALNDVVKIHFVVF